MDTSLAGLAYLYVGANEENKQLRGALEKAQGEIESLREQINGLKEKLDGGDSS